MQKCSSMGELGAWHLLHIDMLGNPVLPSQALQH